MERLGSSAKEEWGYEMVVLEFASMRELTRGWGPKENEEPIELRLRLDGEGRRGMGGIMYCDCGGVEVIVGARQEQRSSDYLFWTERL